MIPVSATECADCGWSTDGLWPTEGAAAAAWIESYLIQPKGDRYGEPLRLRKDQKVFIYRWFEYCGRCSHWRYDEGLRGAATGDGKTVLMAALALLEAFGPPQIAPVDASVVACANSWDQADLLFGAVGIMAGGKSGDVKESPLRGMFNVYESKITRADKVPGMVVRVAAVAGTNEGGAPSLFIADEVHEFGEPGSGRARTHMVIGKSTKKRSLICRIPDGSGGFREMERGPGRILNLSTAGWDVEGTLLGSMYSYGKRSEHDPGTAPKFLFDWRESDDSLDLTVPADRRVAVRQASAAAGVLWDIEARVREWDKPHIPHHEWTRYYANRWVDVADGSWLADHPAAWTKCKGSWILEGDEPTVIGVDMALKRDSVAVVECAKLHNGKTAVTAKIWDPADGKIDHLEVFSYIRDRAHSLGMSRFRGVAYDPRLFELPARMLEDEGLLVIEANQSPQIMAPACGAAFDAIINGDLVHDGNPELAKHVKSAVKREQDRGFTLSKSKSGKRHIDGAVALCIAYFTLTSMPVKKPITWANTVW